MLSFSIKCRGCGVFFERQALPGRTPLKCPSCREKEAAAKADRRPVCRICAKLIPHERKAGMPPRFCDACRPLKAHKHFVCQQCGADLHRRPGKRNRFCTPCAEQRERDRLHRRTIGWQRENSG